MEDNKFISDSAVLLSQCSPEQRARLAEMAKDFGKPKEQVEAQRRQAQDAAAIKSLHERFPHLNRLKG